MNKKQLSERDICTKFIVPAITSAGWDIQDQVREEYFFTAGQYMYVARLSNGASGSLLTSCCRGNQTFRWL